MKIRRRTEIQEVTIKEYVAEDGKVFTSEQDCREYEETMTDSLKVRYDAIPRREEYAEDCMLPTWYSGGAMVHIIRIRDEQDVETLTKWVGRYSGDTRGLTTADIGRLVMLVYDEWGGFEESEYCDVVFYDDYLKTVQEWYARLCEKN